jgi:hypothetical protein
MTEEKQLRFTVIENKKADIKTETHERLKREHVTQPDESYHTNPMYEKLLNYRQMQKKKRFTVEDLLKW